MTGETRLHRRVRFGQYLRSVCEGQELPQAQRARVSSVWAEITSLQPDVLVPSAGTDDGDFYLSWNSTKRMLEVVVAADGSVTWVYADHELNVAIGSEECGKDVYKVLLPNVSSTTQDDIVHMKAGSRSWLLWLEKEKKCGMTHTEETNAWVAAERERESR